MTPSCQAHAVSDPEKFRGPGGEISTGQTNEASSFWPLEAHGLCSSGCRVGEEGLHLAESSLVHAGLTDAEGQA